MARRRSNNKSWIGSLLLGSAVAGVGLSFGRDTYRLTKDNWFLMLAAVLCCGGVPYGAWNIVRGHDRSAAATFWKTYVANGILMLISFTLFSIVVIAMAGKEPGTAGPVILVVQGALLMIGVLIGLAQRPKRMRQMQVDRHNQIFLDSQGFREVGGNDMTLIAPDGAELKAEDYRDDAIVFKVVGRRSVRAKILIDDAGRMKRYVPA